MNSHELQRSISLLRLCLPKNSISEPKIELLKKVIDSIKDYLPISKTIFRPAQLIRVTINKKIPGIGNNRIHQIKHLKYPPAHSVTRYGRCNLVNQSVLYGAFTGLTSSKEMRPEIGDMVTTTTWKMNPGEFLNLCPIFYITSLHGQTHNQLSSEYKDKYHDYLNKKYHISRHAQMNEIMEFLAQSFTKDVDENNNLDYFLSAYLSEVIFNYPTANIDTILYPSAQDYLNTSNMAIKPTIFDKKFHPVDAQEGILTAIYPIISIAGTGWATKFDNEKGIILWP